MLDQALSSHVFRLLDPHDIQYRWGDICQRTWMVASTNLECILAVSSLRHDKRDVGSLSMSAEGL